MLSIHQIRYRLWRIGAAALIGLLMLAASLLVVRMSQAKFSASGAFSCGSLNVAVQRVVTDPDGAPHTIIIHDVATSGPPTVITEDITIQGGWRLLDQDYCDSNPLVFSTTTDVSQAFTYSATVISAIDPPGVQSSAFITVEPSVSNLTIQQIEFRDYDSGRGMTGVISNSAQVRLENVIFRNNGAGLNLEVRGGSRLVISDSQFIENALPLGTGGGFEIRVYDNSQVLIHNTRVLSNSGGFGGDGGGGRILVESGVVTVSHSTFAANAVGNEVDGGGLSIVSTGGPATVWLIGNVFQGNSARGDGGGLALKGNDLAHFYLAGNTFTGNSAPGYSGFASYRDGLGGGLYQDGGHSHLANNVFAGNGATRGDGIYVNDGTSEIVHTTIVAPATDGDAGILVQGGTVGITNTLIAGPFATGLQRNGGTVSEDYNLYADNAQHRSGVTKGAHTIDDGDPDFVDPANDDYHLGPDSAAKDKGVDAGVTTDIDGDSRPQGFFFDIGADERLVTLYPVYLPVVIKN